MPTKTIMKCIFTSFKLAKTKKSADINAGDEAETQ